MGKNQLSLKDREALSAKLDWAEFYLHCILKGEKAPIDQPEEIWLYKLLTALYEGQLISSPANAYLRLPSDTPEMVSFKGETHHHAISARFVLNQKRKLTDNLHSAGIHNFYVMGSDDVPAEDADHYVLAPSGIEAAHQTLVQLQKNMNGLKKMTIIQNNDYVWSALIDYLGLGNPAISSALGCVVTKNREATKNAILYSGQNIQKAVTPSSRTLMYQNGMEILFGSTQPKKGDESGQILDHEKVYAGLREAVIPLHWFLSADEISKTFEGNTREKIDTMLDRIYDHIGYDEVCRRLREKGFDPARVVFCANDTGVDFSEDLSDEIEFAASRDEKTPGKPWPGVELGPIVDAQGGIVKFMSDVKACRKRLGRHTPLRYRDTQLYMFFKLEPRKEDVRVQSYFGTGTGFVIPDPRPTDKGSLYTENYCVPDGQPEGAKGKTQAELGKTYLFTDSPQARCLRAIMVDHQIPPSVKSIFCRAAKLDKRSLLRLMTQDNFISGVNHRSGGAGFDRVVRDNGWKLSAKTYPDSFEDFAAAGSAIYLGPHSKAILADYDRYASELSLLFCKAGTHKQILHDVMYKKALMICNPELQFFKESEATGRNWADPAMGEKFIAHLKSLDPAQDPWARQLLLYYYYHENSLIKQKPEYIWQQATLKDLPSMLRKVRDEREPHGIINYKKEEYGSDREDLFSVTILGSASTRNQLYTTSAYDIGYQCAHEGIHLRSGGGRYGIMGAASHGYMKYQDTHPGRAPYTHLSAIQMPRTVQFEGLAMNIKSAHKGGNRYIAIEPGMDQRMRNLFRSDVVIADAGGLGTLEEILYFIVLKQRGDPLVKDKPLIIINHAHLGPDAIKLYDPLLALLPERDRKDIHVVADARAAMELTLRFKRDGYKPEASKILNSRGLPLSPS